MPTLAASVSGLFALCLVVVLFVSPLAAAEIKPAPTTSKRLDEAEKALRAGKRKAEELKRQASQLEREMTAIHQGLVAAARIIQDYEQRVAKIKQRLAELDSQQAEKETTLKGQRAKMGRVLVALQRVARYPPVALIAQRVSPADTVRSAILLRATVSEFGLRARRMRDDIQALNAAKAEALEQRTELARISDGLENQRSSLRNMLGQKSRLRRRTVAKSVAAERQVKKLAYEAASLRELIVRLELMRKKREAEARSWEDAKGKHKNLTAAGVPSKPERDPPSGVTGKPITLARGTLRYPVVGKLVERYGQTSEGGLTANGITIVTSLGAQVVAPYEGRVVFAGKFRGYGQLLIIEHSEGYHSLLAGMARIDTLNGQWVLVGEPVGVMGRAEGKRPSLYVELRQNGQPKNPLPWLAAHKDKVSG